MPIVVYRTYATTVPTAQVSATCVRDGTLVGVRLTGLIEGAAGTTTHVAEAAINIGTTVNYSTNNPDRKSAVASAACGVIAATMANYDTGFVPCDCPVRAADVFTMSYSNTITTPTRGLFKSEWYVEEKG